MQVASLPGRRPVAEQPNDGLREELRQIRSLVREVLRESRRSNGPAVSESLMGEYVSLIQAEVAEELARGMVERLASDLSAAEMSDRRAVQRKLCDYIASMVPAGGEITAVRSGRPKVVAMVGPTGVGKTTTIAKLAAHFKLRENRRVGLVTIDTYRIAAVDQLRTYAEIIDVPLEVVVTPDELTDAMARLDECDIVLIDTAGRGQNDAIRLNELKQFLDVAKPDETHLVLACNSNPTCLLQAIEHFGRIGIDRVAFTKLDEAVGFGVVLTVLRRIDKKLSYLTTGQDVPDDIEIGRGQRIAELILSPSGTAGGLDRAHGENRCEPC